jgi:cytochrome c
VNAIDACYPSRYRSLAARIFVAMWFAITGVASAGDSQRGGELYLARCGACHSIPDNGAGPRHLGLVGRRAGTQPGYDYSTALKDSKITWTAKTLDRWLRDPSAFVPGNKMVVRLADDPTDRADIVTFLLASTPAKPSGSDKTTR